MRSGSNRLLSDFVSATNNSPFADVGALAGVKDWIDSDDAQGTTNLAGVSSESEKESPQL